MLSVGEKLQRARVEHGLDLDTVASLTKVNLKYLRAIEADDRASLPSAFFYKSFVHQYASMVSLDPRELDAEIDAVLKAEAPLPLPGQETREARSLPRMKVGGYRFYKESPFASYVALGLVLLGCSGIYSWWHKVADQKTIISAPSRLQHAPLKGTQVQRQYPLLSGYRSGLQGAFATAGSRKNLVICCLRWPHSFFWNPWGRTNPRTSKVRNPRS